MWRPTAAPCVAVSLQSKNRPCLISTLASRAASSAWKLGPTHHQKERSVARPVRRMLFGVIPTISTSRLCKLRGSGKVALRTRSCAWISLKAPPRVAGRARSSGRRVRAFGAKAAERKPHVTRERTQLSARSSTDWWQRMRVWIQQPRPRGPRPHDETNLISELHVADTATRRARGGPSK